MISEHSDDVEESINSTSSDDEFNSDWVSKEIVERIIIKI